MSRDLKKAHPILTAKYLEIKREWERLHPDWELRPTTVDRTVAEQQEAFRLKRSRLDGVKKKSKHNLSPSLAIDVGIFRRADGSYLDTLLQRKIVTQQRFDELFTSFGKIAQRLGLRWGNDWDGDGVLVGPDPDESLSDPYHIELKGEKL
jgi:hypothetical protein